MKHILTLIFLSLVAYVYPSTWVVSATASPGGDGTLAKPFNTVNQAARIAKPGDIIYLRGGVQQFTDTAGVMCSGTASARITVTSYPGERAIVDGGRFAPLRDGFWVSGSYVTIKDIDVRNTTGCGISLYHVKGVTVSGVKVYGCWKSGIAAQGHILGENSEITISGNTVFDCVRLNIGYPPGTGWPPALQLLCATNSVVDGNKVYGNYGEGIGINRSSNCLVSRNSVADSYSVNIYLDNVTNSVVSRNYSTCTSKSAFFRGGYPAAGIQIANEPDANRLPNLSDGCEISSNIIKSTGYGLVYKTYGLGGGLRNFRIINNSFLRCTGLMFWIQPDPGTVGTVIGNNIFRQTGQYSFVNCSSGAGLQFASNCWYGGYVPDVVRGPGDVYQDPMFLRTDTNTGPADFGLQPGSPCIGAATGVIASTDYAGLLRAASGGSLGAVDWR